MTQKNMFFYLSVMLLSFLGGSRNVESAESKICLTMIVKNESKIITRCLDQVKEIVDCICICDTGSEDNTVEIIEDFLQKNHIPGKVYHHDWKDFGYNRNLSVKASVELLNELHFSLPETYLLLLDADMLLKITPEFHKAQLRENGYVILQKSYDISYYNIRLIKASLPWQCLGVTHEYWACHAKRSSEKLHTLWIDDRGDGGSKEDKFERDIKLLQKGLEKEPYNARYTFYLAQSYMCINQHEEAISWYQKRIALGGWEEEVWYAKYKIGSIYEKLEQWDLAEQWYLDAYEYLPSRAEPLVKMACNYRMRREFELAYFFAKMAKKIPYPEKHLLFVEDAVYDYKIDEELSISSYYASHKEEGFAANERLIMNKKCPDYVKWQAKKNRRFYVSNLPGIYFQPINLQIPYFNCMNPSISKVDDGFLVVCRCVNYKQKGGRNYQMLNSSSPFAIKTRNFLLHYDKEFTLLSKKEILDTLSSSHRGYSRNLIEGLEDIRLFQKEDTFRFTCTLNNMTKDHVPKIGLFGLEHSFQNNTVATESFTLLEGPDPKRCEKNWLPFVKEGEIHAIYSYAPFTLYKIDEISGSCLTVLEKEYEKDFSEFRGSAGPIPFLDGYLGIVHEVGEDDVGDRIYFHRFFYLDQNYHLTKTSQPFIYKHIGIEYCAGMAIDHEEKKLIITLGIEDAEAYLAFVDLDVVYSLLDPVQ